MIFVFAGLPAKAPKFTASKDDTVQRSFAAFMMAAAGTMECAPDSATYSTVASLFR